MTRVKFGNCHFINIATSSKQHENLGSNELLLYVAIEPEALDEAGQPPVAALRKKHSVGSGPVQGTMAPAPRVAYSYQVKTQKNIWIKSPRLKFTKS